jgi:hypothetical protein
MKAVPRLLGIAVLAVVSTAACGDALTEPTDERERQEFAVYEAVFRHQFTHNESGLQDAAGAYCLALQDASEAVESWRDPSPLLMRRFDSHRPRVRGVSQCRVSVSGNVDVATGLRALVFRAGPIGWNGPTGATVDGGYHEGGLSASGKTYVLHRRDGAWVVVEDRWRWIS